MGNDEDRLEPSQSVEGIPLVGEPIKSGERFFLAIHLYYREPGGWVRYINNDRYALRSLSTLSAGLILTYLIMKSTTLQKNQISKKQFDFDNLFFIIVFVILSASFIKIIGFTSRFLSIISGLTYILAMILPIFCLAVILNWLIAKIFQKFGFDLSSAIYIIALSACFPVVLRPGIDNLSTLSAISPVKFCCVIILAGLATFAAMDFCAQALLDFSEKVAKILE